MNFFIYLCHEYYYKTVVKYIIRSVSIVSLTKISLRACFHVATAVASEHWTMLRPMTGVIFLASANKVCSLSPYSIVEWALHIGNDMAKGTFCVLGLLLTCLGLDDLTFYLWH